MTETQGIDEIQNEPEKSKKPNKKIIIGVLVVALLAVALVCVGFAFAGQSGTNEESQSPAESDVYVKLVGTDGNTIVNAAVIVKADGETLDNANKAIGKTVELGLNAETKLATLPAGDYKIHLTGAPVMINGDTFKLPKEAVTFTVNGDGEKQIVEIKLELLKVGDMTKQQLEATAARIEAKAPEYADVAAGLKEKAQTATDDPESGKDVEQPSNAEGTSDTPVTPAPAPDNGGSTVDNGSDNNNGNTGGNTGGGNTGGNTPAPTQPTPPAHEHNWTPIYGAAPWIVDVPAQPAQYGERAYYLTSDGTRFEKGQESAMAMYLRTNGGSYRMAYEQYQISPAVPEQGHYGPAPIIGYRCDCGASK